MRDMAKGRRTVEFAGRAPGKSSGRGPRLWAYSYSDLAHLLSTTEDALRARVSRGSFSPGNLEEVCRAWASARGLLACVALILVVSAGCMDLESNPDQELRGETGAGGAAEADAGTLGAGGAAGAMAAGSGGRSAAGGSGSGGAVAPSGGAPGDGGAASMGGETGSGGATQAGGAGGTSTLGEQCSDASVVLGCFTSAGSAALHKDGRACAQCYNSVGFLLPGCYAGTPQMLCVSSCSECS
jgi:hypothetical protein